MINKRLIALLGRSKRFIFGSVACQWGMLLCNIGIVSMIGLLIRDAAYAGVPVALWPLGVIGACILLRHGLTVWSAKMNARASGPVKKTLRLQIYSKLLRLGASYHETVPTAEVVQVATEGVEQLETYYGAFLPQFFYSMVAPVTLFAFMALVHLPAAIVLLVLVPLIPIAIVAVQRIAKRLLGQYWGQYAKLGDSFLESLMGLTTLKIYQADEKRAREMAAEAENFRVVTMKVLTMQLNSITVMDIIAYGGAALGLIFALWGYASNAVDLWGCFVIIMLSAEFFLPLRALGSYFHTAMNGMAASDRMFRILDLPEAEPGTQDADVGQGMELRGLGFTYDGSREILRGVDMVFPAGRLVSIVGESGSGKSTIASILTGRCRRYTGSAMIGKSELKKVREESLMASVTCINHKSYLFKGTVADNLRMGNPAATEAELWQALEQVKLKDFLLAGSGLETAVAENGANLSGGQRQRLALARGILHDSSVYIFDEATSNIDVESENDINRVIHQMAGRKTVIMISHRLANVVNADCIYVLADGAVTGAGRHEALLVSCPAYQRLWHSQAELERYGVAG